MKSDYYDEGDGDMDDGSEEHEYDEEDDYYDSEDDETLERKARLAVMEPESLGFKRR
jgi:hypothetical protein